MQYADESTTILKNLQSRLVPRMKKSAQLQCAVGITAFFGAFGCDLDSMVLAQENILAEASGMYDASNETFFDWHVTCRKLPALGDDASEQVCEMRQEVLTDDMRVPKITFAMQMMDGGPDAVTSLIVPFGMRVSAPVTLELAEICLAEFAFRTCLPQGCIVTGALDQAAAARMSREEFVELRMIDATEEPIQVKLSLMGFADAWGRMMGDTEVISATDTLNDGLSTATGEASAGVSDALQADAEQATTPSIPKPQVSTLKRPFTQIGFFREEGNARGALMQVQREGLRGEIRKTKAKGKTFWRVLIGPADSTFENNRMLALARSLGFKDAYHVRG